MANIQLWFSKNVLNARFLLSRNFCVTNSRFLSNTPSYMCAASEKKNEDLKLQEQEEKQESSSLEKEYLEKIEKLTNKAEDFKDKYQRTLADRENVRTRLQKEIADSRIYSIQSFCKDLLEVTDIFKKAVESVPEKEIKDASITFKNLYDGVVMTENQLNSVLRRHGLTQIIPNIGQKFDPSEHEAMFEVPVNNPDSESGTVAHLVRSGWKLHERCIRSAQVGVFKG